MARAMRVAAVDMSPALRLPQPGTYFQQTVMRRLRRRAWWISHTIMVAGECIQVECKGDLFISSQYQQAWKLMTWSISSVPWRDSGAVRRAIRRRKQTVQCWMSGVRDMCNSKHHKTLPCTNIKRFGHRKTYLEQLRGARTSPAVRSRAGLRFYFRQHCKNAAPLGGRLLSSHGYSGSLSF